LTLPRIQGVRHWFETSSSQLGPPECSTGMGKMQTDVLPGSPLGSVARQDTRRVTRLEVRTFSHCRPNNLEREIPEEKEAPWEDDFGGSVL
jgi:hypothetical protein